MRWELVVKRADQLLVSFIVFTNTFSTRDKLMMLAFESAMFWLLNEWVAPYDDRRNLAADRMEFWASTDNKSQPLLENRY